MVGDLYTTARNVRGGIVAELCAAGFEDAEEIGRGGCGAVYRCTQAGLDRVVAVKVLSVELGQNRARFVREQHAMGRLTGHPNIVAVLQVGETEFGRPYLVMPYCCQGCVQEQIRRCGVLGLEEVLRLGVKMAGALESAHRLGVLHRDVKPANILLDDYDEPELCDFGIARLSGDFETATGIVAGSAAFLAPELLGGEAPSPASDVYGLGATLFCALTGHAAFERRNDEPAAVQLFRIATEAVPDLRDLGIADDCAAVVENAMSRDWRNRPSARELGEEIQHVQACHGFVVDEMRVYGAERSDRPGESAPARVRGPGARLPEPPESLVGRRAELAKLRELLTRARLVTLTGIGGVGKTTLASHAAAELRSQFLDGVWWVELADLRDGTLLIEVVAAALGVRDQLGRQLTEVVVGVLRERQALVVLDNCEHIIDDAAKLVDALLRACPRLEVLATSREVLDVGGEAVLALSPLACPDPDGEPTLSWGSNYAAVALFVERARAALPGFALSEHNAAAVARICVRLDGLPLALELAAARMRAMSVEQIADGLLDRDVLLTRGRRGVPTRQQTLAGCIEWSYELCTSAEQQLWGRLSVFAGSFDLSAAHHICGDEVGAGELLDELARLLDKSILIRAEHDGTVLFRLLDTLRDYGRARMDDADQYQLLQRRHAGWYQRLLADARAEWFGPHQSQWMRRVARQMPNIRLALQFSLSECPAGALAMAEAMRWVWITRGMLSEASRWLGLALTATPQEPSALRVLALYAAAGIANMQGDLAAAKNWIREARKLLEEVDDPAGRSLIDFAEGHTALFSGDLERARECLQRAAASDDFEVKVSSTMLMGWVLYLTGDEDHAVSLFDKALAVAESQGESKLRSHALVSCGIGRWRQGQPAAAEQLIQQCLRLSVVANDPVTGAQGLEVLAWITGSTRTNNARRTVVLMAAACTLNRATGADFFVVPHLAAFHDECERRARDELDPKTFDAASREGTLLTFEEAVAVALEDTARQHVSSNAVAEFETR